MNFKSIEITPVDEEMNLRAQSLEILNCFRAKGLTVKSQFLTKVFELDPTVNNNEGVNKLSHFWLGRYHNEDFNDYLKTLLKKI